MAPSFLAEEVFLQAPEIHSSAAPHADAKFDHESGRLLARAEVAIRHGLCRGFEAAELATSTWDDLLNSRRLLDPLCNIPTAEVEER